MIQEVLWLLRVFAGRFDSKQHCSIDEGFSRSHNTVILPLYKSRHEMTDVKKRLSYMTTDDWNQLRKHLRSGNSGWYYDMFKRPSHPEDMLLAAQELLREAYDKQEVLLSKATEVGAYNRGAIARRQVSSEDEVDAAETEFLFDEMHNITGTYCNVMDEIEVLERGIKRKVKGNVGFVKNENDEEGDGWQED